MIRRNSSFALAVTCLALLGADRPAKQAAEKEALLPIQMFVGQWRGVGQVRRGSNRGAWIEQSDWAWSFADKRAALTFSAPKSKYFTGGTLRPGDKAGEFQLTTTTVDGKGKRAYSGRLDKEGRLVLLAEEVEADAPARVTIRTVAGDKRLVMLLERKSAGPGGFTRLAEVGYTRKGSMFGKGTGYPECIVTGGRGTMAVTHDGKTYYVCCSGCRDLFNEDPAAALAEYRQRKDEEKAQKKSSPDDPSG